MDKDSIPFTYNWGTKIVFILIGLFGVLVLFIAYVSRNRVTSVVDFISLILVGYILLRICVSSFFQRLVFDFQKKEIILVQGLLIRNVVRMEEMDSWGTKFSTGPKGSGLTLNIVFKMKDGGYKFTNVNPDAKQLVFDQIKKMTSQEPKDFVRFNGNFFTVLLFYLIP